MRSPETTWFDRNMTTAEQNVQERALLERSRIALVSGVAEGLANHLGWRARTVRILLILTAAVGSPLLYAWLWALVPVAEPTDDAEPQAVRRQAPVAWIALSVAIGLAIIAVAGVALGMVSVTAWFWASLGAQALAAFAALWAGLLDINDPERGPRHAATVRLLAGILLACVLIVHLLSTGSTLSPPLNVVAAMGALIALLTVFVPPIIERFRLLGADRVKRIQEEQRSSMAAHLHDSVLQTLALIQNRAGASSEVARIARAQERELRGWLYDGDEPADSDLPTDLRDFAAALELDYPVHIDVVAAGTSTERASGDLAAAAREAMLNAARHAGGDISVYIEGSVQAVAVFVRDRGAGFNLDDVPADRLGVRQSILGRMRRAGGTAEVRQGIGGQGTEVKLRIARDEDHIREEAQA